MISSTQRCLHASQHRGHLRAAILIGRQGAEGQIQIVEIKNAEAVPPGGGAKSRHQDWSPTLTSNPVDLTSNVHLMTQEQQTALQRQVAKAMPAAGIQPGDPAALTGTARVASRLRASPPILPSSNASRSPRW
ncbi:MAG: hypothetical protein IPL93_15265 [Actinomycetales bacterium]|nr:hypothetical protein [Actinomycetales bacterium]